MVHRSVFLNLCWISGTVIYTFLQRRESLFPNILTHTCRLETYDWRAAESRFNSLLPQFRTTIRTTSPTGTQSLRVHFVHKRSTRPGAIPLLLAHTWPSSFIEVQRIINALTEPPYVPDMGGAVPQAFHVVAPSIPGFGFSDASMQEGFGLEGTAEVFWELMGRLGYSEFVAHGTGW